MRGKCHVNEAVTSESLSNKLSLPALVKDMQLCMLLLHFG